MQNAGAGQLRCVTSEGAFAVELYHAHLPSVCVFALQLVAKKALNHLVLRRSFAPSFLAFERADLVPVAANFERAELENELRFYGAGVVALNLRGDARFRPNALLVSLRPELAEHARLCIVGRVCENMRLMKTLSALHFDAAGRLARKVVVFRTEAAQDAAARDAAAD